jgi:hypothetical protein
MDVGGLVTGIMFAFTGLIFAALTLPLRRREVGINGAYGVRIARTYASEKVWYEVNAYFGRKMLGWALALSAMGIVEVVVSALSPDLMPLPLFTVFFGLFLLFLSIPIAQTLTYAKHFEP